MALDKMKSTTTLVLPQLHRNTFCACIALITLATALVAEKSHAIKQQHAQPIKLYTLSASEPVLANSDSRRAYSWNNKELRLRQLQLDQGHQDDEHLTNELDKVNALDGDHDASAKLIKTAPTWSDNNKWPMARNQIVRAPSSAAKRQANARGTTAASDTKGTKGRRTSGTKQPPRRLAGPGVRKFAQAPPVELDVSANASEPRRQTGKRKTLVCYYGTWAVYRPGAGRFAVENIDPFLCTHVIYGFTGLSYDNLIKPLDPWNDLEDNYGKGAMKRFTNLKRQNPELKTLVAIGGWNEGSIKYSKMASQAETRAKFIDSVVKFLAKYNFDGLDLDWEYPGSRGGSAYDKQNFVALLRELSAAFKPRGYLLTAAVSAGKWFIDPAYDIGQVSKYLDLINLMAYDYHGGWESKTGHNAPLFSSRKHDRSREEQQLNVNWSVNYWLAHGAPREKLLLGVGSYGRSFTLDRESENGINAPASQKGRAGPYTREPGSLGYNEICEALLEKGANSWTIVRDPDYLAPYAFTNNGQRQWVGYDDRQSLALKAQYAKSMGLGGMMMWSIETDDFQGRCHGGEKFPLLNTIRRVLDSAAPDVPKPDGQAASTTVRPSVAPAGGSSTRRPVRTTTPGHEVEEVDEQRPASTSRPRPPIQPAQPGTSRRPVATSTRRPISTTPTTRRPATVGPTTSSTTTTTTTQAPPPSPDNVRPTTQEFICRTDGMFADPNNCRKFIRCIGAGTPFAQRFSFDCGPGTAFSEQLQACDHIHNVPSCNHQQPTARRELAVTTKTTQTNAVDQHHNNQQATPLIIVPAPLAANHHHLMLARHFYPLPTATNDASYLLAGAHHPFLGF